MKRIVISLAVLMAISLCAHGVSAFFGAGARGGSFSHSFGSTSWSGARGGSFSHSPGSTDWSGAAGGSFEHSPGSTSATDRWGGSASGSYGSGWSATSRYGGTASGSYGSGWKATSAYGTTAYGYGHYYGGTYSTYHPPTTVNVYGSGCYDCGGWSTAGAAAAGAAVGMATGAAIASANTSAASANAYSAGYAAGSANTAYAMGAIYATLPAGCISSPEGSTNYYICGTSWLKPSFGANGVYYRVVPAPY